MGCSSEGTAIRVDLKTDLIPLQELESIEVRLDGEMVVELPADASVDYVDGINLTTVEDVSRGLHEVEVILVAVGEDLERTVQVDVQGRVAVTLVMSRDCRDVNCRTEGLMQCLGGRCVGTECFSENPDACEPDPECMVDGDCASPSACGVPRCIDGVCLFGADLAVCESSEMCDPEVGCGTRSRGAMPTVEWSLGLAATGGETILHAVAVGAADEIYVAGRLRGRIDLGGGELISDESDILVASFDADGAHRWSRVIGGSGGAGTEWEEAFGIAVGSDGNVWVVGSTAETTDLGGGPLSGDDLDGFVLALDASGNFRWGRTFVDAENGRVRGVAADDLGNVYIAGEFEGRINLDETATIVSAGDELDAFVASYDTSGALRWFDHLSTPGRDRVGRVRALRDGSIWVTGSIQGDRMFGAGLVEVDSDPNTFVAAYAPDGTNLLARGYGVNDPTHGTDLAMTSSGGLVVSGSMRNQLELAGQRFSSFGEADGLTFGIDAVGDARWARHFGHPSSDGVSAVVIDASDNAIVTGEFERTVDFGGGLISTGDGCEIFLASYDDDGAHRWSIALGNLDDDGGNDLALDSTGHLYVVGMFRGVLDLGGTIGEDETVAGLVAKLDLP